MRAWLRRAVVLIAVLYPLALLSIVLFFRLVGERWWVTNVGLYLPRLPFAVPLPFIVLGLVFVRPRLVVWASVGAAVVLLCIVVGFVPPRPSFGGGDGQKLRVLSCNINSGYGGFDELSRKISELSPDVILLQELSGEPKEFVSELRGTYAHVEVSTQFLLANRHYVFETVDPDRIAHGGKDRSPRFLRHVLETPIGPVVFYNVHPVSPRSAFNALRGDGLRREILTGRLFSGAAAEALHDLSTLRQLQVEAFGVLADKETLPVVIAGDLNLPSLSPVWAHLSRYKDGFAEAGWGLGYTYPVHEKWPTWMRLDRILASEPLRFIRFEVLEDVGSDHLCVAADLTR